MTDLLIDPLTNDLSLDQGTAETVAAAQAKAQRIRSRLLTVRGEWFLDLTFGLDYYGVIWVKETSNAVIAAHIQREILRGADAGDQITAFTMARDSATRSLTVTAELTASDGTTINVSI